MDLSVLQKVLTGSGAHLPSYSMITGGSFPGLKPLGLKLTTQPTYGTEVKNGWSSISTLPHTPSWHAGTTLLLRTYGFEIWYPVQIK